MARLAIGSIATALALGSLAPAAVAAQRPVVERVEPTSGPPGIEVQIVGRHLDRETRLWLDDRELEVLRRQPNRWKLRVPEQADTGSAHIVLETADGRYRGPRFRVTEPPPPPKVDRLEPSTAPPGAEVVLHGESFSTRPADNDVTFGGRPVVVRSATPTALHVIVPSGAESGSFVVTVEHAGRARSPELEVVAPTEIASVEPMVATPGSEIAIRGTGFAERRRHNRVYLGNRRLRVREASSTELVVRLPRRGISSAPLLVDVRGAGRDETHEPFEVQRPPRVTRLAPRRLAVGHDVTIHGRHFGSDAQAVQVRVGDEALEVRRVRPDRIVARAQSGVHGGSTEPLEGRVTVQVHEARARSRRELTVLPPLRVEGFEPRSAPAGDEVTIRGGGFSPRRADNRVTISGERARVLRASPQELRVRVPDAASGPVVVSVEDGDTVRTDDPFLVTQPPVIDEVDPRSGAPGSEVTIRGERFGDEAALVSVLLGGRPMDVKSVSEERIVAVVPDGADSGRITVRVRLQGSDTSRRDFRVTD